MLKKVKERGITLIALIVTIIVLMLLAGVAVTTLTGENGILTQATNATKENKIAEKKEEVALALNTAIIRHLGNKNEVTIEEVLTEIKNKYSKQKEKDAIYAETEPEEKVDFAADIIYDNPASGLRESIRVIVNDDLQIVGGELVVPDQYTKYETVTPVESDYTKIDKFGNTYCNAPDLSGFNEKDTYYVTYDASNNPVIQGRIDRVSAPNGWYDYEHQIWANVVTVNNGQITYWTWIPRYVYKLTSSNEIDVQFVNMQDKYYTNVNDTSTLTSYDSATYIKPDSFKFDKTDLAGFWITKYKLQEETTTNPAYATIGNKTVTVDKTGEKNKYKVFVEGAVYDDGREQTLPLEIKTTNKNLNVLLVDTTTKDIYVVDNQAHASTKNIQVDLSGFEPSVTKYVTYDNNGNETIGDNIQLDANGKATNMPKGWYDYVNKKWANIVTINNGNTTYWTYIPRYKYRMWGVTNLMELEFIGTSTTTATNGFTIPDAFTFNNQDLPGYWVSKYKLQEGTDNDTTQIVGTTNKIEVDLSGFEPNVTKYVTYDSDGTEKIGDKIKLDANKKATNMPKDWYDYKNKKWANIVTQNGGKTTYWTYIPRYKYSIWSGSNQVQVKFIDTTVTSATNGFKIPDAFNFGGPLKGYWITKYKLQE